MTSIYLLVGAAWILLSDTLLHGLVADGNVARRLQTYKGWFFVSTTAVLLFLLIRQAVAALHTAKEVAEECARQAEEADAAKDRFIASLSHELRTPLTPVLAAATGLLQRKDLPDEVRADVQAIARNVELEARLIDDLLDLTRATAGAMQLRHEPVDVHELVEVGVEFCRPEIREKGLRLEIALDATRHWVNGDRARLVQVWWNLLRNAVKFTPSGGTIRVESRQNDRGTLVVAVKDSGVGIDGETMPRLFRAFAPGQAAPDTGLGMGLALCKTIVEQHGGTISASSAGRGMGAMFAVELAALKAEDEFGVIRKAPEPVTAEGPAAAPPADAGLRILLVEDHADTARLLARLLRSMKHKVSVAESVAAALALALTERFDVLMSDIGLPDGTGWDLMEKLRAQGPIVGIALSGFGSDEDVQRSLTVGFSEHLVKPVSVDRLEAALAGCMAKA